MRTGWAERRRRWSGPLHFDGSTLTSSSNDLAAGTAIAGLVFNSTAAAFNLSGNAIGLTQGIVNNSTNTQTVNLPMTLLGNANINAAAGPIVLNFQPTVVTAGYQLSVAGTTRHPGRRHQRLRRTRHERAGHARFDRFQRR